MRKSFAFQQHHQQQQAVDQESMSNLTSASGEAASVSSDSHHQQQLQHFAPPQQQPIKKKRNLPGNPDPEAEVIALSPKSLMATNRFVCTICNKGFQRDQNLQLHRRGHNLPWKLKQRSSNEVARKKVYVCPEAGCVHHDPSRALGDLTGIKKHFYRKHGEKKWKCDKCSKRYAVLSDWKAHSKTCGTREYRCDCGTLFSRRDSFITHRAFCDALAQESARAITTHEYDHHLPVPPSDLLLSNSHHQILHHQQLVHHQNQNLHASIFKKEQQDSSARSSWLGAGPPSSSIILSSSRADHHHQELIITQENQDQEYWTNPSPRVGPTLVPGYHQAAAQMSATALLQKAAQMGSTMSSKNKTVTAPMRPHAHESADDHSLNLSSRDDLVHASTSFGNKAVHTPFPEDSMVMMTSPGFEQDPFGCIFTNPTSSTNQDQDYHENGFKFSEAFSQTPSRHSGSTGGGGEGLTRDFLGLRPLLHSDILSMAGFDSTSADLDHHHHHNPTEKRSWSQQ